MERFLFPCLPNVLFFISSKPTKFLDKNERKDAAETDLLESESSPDSGAVPKLSNVVVQTKTVILLQNYSLGLNNFV